MTGRFEGFDELRELLHALCEESITPEQMQRLERLVLEHPDAEAYYVQYMGLQADLVGHVGVPVARTEQSLLGYVGGARSGRTKPPHRNGRGWARRRVVKAAALVLSAAAAVLIAVTLWPRPQPAPLPRPPAPEATDDSVAVLVQAAGAEWDATGLPTRAGAALSPGWLHLKSGVARIEFYSGAIVILEGPAEFQLVSRTEAFCRRGKLRASVPSQAQGFTIGSPKLDLIDRGTEFGLEVGDKTEVHVFEGKVEVYEVGAKRAPAARQELTTGHALRV